MSERDVVIEQRYCGPPNSGNGGYCAGILAEPLAGAVEVTLRAPPPLARPLQLRVDAEQTSLRAGEQLIADARRAQLQLDVPEPPSFEAASECAQRFAGFGQHVFPTCFVCGPARAQGDGLRIFPGASSAQLVAAPFVPHASLAAGPHGSELRPAIAWAALDCAGYFATGYGQTALLGRMTAELTQLPLTGERYVVIGWPLGRDGRKIYAGTALFDASGRLFGCARQTWIAVG